MTWHGLFACDFDGVLQTECRSSWELLHQRLGVWEPDGRRFLESYLSGAIGYEEFCRMDAGLWSGRRVADIHAVLEDVSVIGGAEETVASVKAMGFHTVLVSTGIDILTKSVAERIGFDQVVSNVVVARDGVLTGEVEIAVPWDGKGAVLESLQAEHRVPPDHTVSVGDSEADLPMLERSGLGILFNPTDELAASVDAGTVIRSDDLRAILPHVLDYVRRCSR